MNNTSTFIIDNKWESFSKQLDNFATFMWRGESSTKYHMFIINEKNSLKFYNTSGFSNEYVNTKFQNTAQLLGVNYKMPQTLSFKVGIYWFNIEEYQKTLLWLSPSVIDYFNFDFNTEYSYLVKLGAIQETSKRYILGYGANHEPYYYTELDLKFDLQGENNLRSIVPYELDKIPGEKTSQYVWTFADRGDTKGVSVLNTPLLFSFSIEVSLKNSSSINSKLDDFFIDFKVQDQASIQNLFRISFNQITINDLSFTNSKTILDCVYDSQTGLIFLQNGNNFELLNLVTEDSHGEYIVNDLSINKYMLPSLEDNIENYNDIKFICEIKEDPNFNINLVKNNQSEIWTPKNSNITIYKRSNII